MRAVYPLIPAFSRPKLEMLRSGSELPRQVGLVKGLAMGVFEEVAIDLKKYTGKELGDRRHTRAASPQK